MPIKNLILIFSLFVLLPLHAKTWKNYQLINGCHILDSMGKSIKRFPGNFCQFLEDGSYLSANETNLKFQTKNSELIWELPGNYHHQLNLSHDQKRILVLSYSQSKAKKKLLRQDMFRIISMDGKIIHEAHAVDYLKQINQKNFVFSEEEITHFNSFYEIPPMDSKLKLPNYIKAGNFILNAYKLGVFIVSPDLKTVLHHRSLSNSKFDQTHDVQILPNGKLIYFNNRAQDEGKSILFSSIDEIDLTQEKLNILFNSEPKQMFFSRHCGGVQYLDNDHILFSHMLAGTYIYSLKEKKILVNLYRTHLDQGRFYPVQQIKALDLEKFLSHWIDK